MLRMVSVYDWPKIRAALAAMLADQHPAPTVRAFAEAAHIKERTVYRITKGEKEDEEIKVTTMEGWLQACGSPLTVGQFLQRFETYPVTESVHTGSSPTTEQERSDPDGGAVTLSTPTVELTDAETDFAEKLALILLGAVQARRLNPATLRVGDPAAARRRARLRLAGQNSQTVPRLEPE